ncbi:P-loop containing nucleoside triphosphate hydrolase [Apiospora sp. TS-2023a]
MKTTWKDIAPVPTSQEFLDIVLSRTQRRLPTQIRSGFKISRIRGFYTRKVKFTSETCTEKVQTHPVPSSNPLRCALHMVMCDRIFDAILNGFPRLADIHPFHADLLNTLYSRDHLKISLGQISTAKHLVETISRDYVRLIKYAQSLYQCKQLKRAALGRMATLVKRLKDPLLYLDQVREHLGRLPSIDPTTRTLLICGYPNVGKSSFLKSVTRADVEVEPYAFTTKSLFVGHFDYKYLRFQAIDTPGLLDSPLESKGPIELQSITAIAHLRSALLYFFDLSEQCGYSVHAQIELFKSLKPLFANKLVFLVVNKIDVMRPEDLDAETAAEFQSLLTDAGVEMLQLSCNTQEGVQEVKNAACERLIADRAAAKVKAGTNNSGDVGGRLADVMKRIHVAVPDGPVRESFIPEAIKNMKKYEKTDPERRRLARDVEEENGGAGVYNVDLRADYLLENDEWKQDRIPELFDGKNVYDHVDPDIEAKLQALEEEEERLEAEGFYESEEEIDDEEEAQIRTKAELIREKQALIRNEARMRKSLKNRAVIPRKLVKQPLSELEEGLDVLGVDTTDLGLRARAQANTRGRSVTRSRMGTEDADAMDVDSTPRDRLRSKSRARSPQMNRREDGVADDKAKEKAERAMKLGQRKMNRMAKQGEADRHVGTAMPKHLFAGKRSMGKTSRR